MFDRDPATNPEQELWQAVLMRQVEDALYAVAGVSGADGYSNRLLHCHEARHYLTRPSKNLSIICANAGLDMEAVIDAMKKRIAEAPSPERIASAERTKPVMAKEPKPKPIPFRDQSFTINGTTRTATEWSLHTGINIQTMQSRMQKGWDVDRAFLATPEQVKQERKAEMKRRAQRDIANRTAKAKRDQNLTQQPTQQRHDNKAILYEYKGESLTLRGWSDRTGVSYSTLYKRINKQGMTLAQAIESPIVYGRPLKQSA